jgi:hypothetical protein
VSTDAGLQPQRTTLSWSRTALAIAVNGLLVLRAGLQASDWSLLGAAAVIGAAALVVFVAGTQRRRALQGAPVAASARLMLFTALAVLFSGAAGLLAVAR